MHTRIRHERRVARGAAMLDDRWPGWRDLIDWDRLDVASVDDCILGQLAEHERTGSWAFLAEIRGLENVADCGIAEAHGFLVTDWEPGEWRKTYDALTAAWRAAVER